MGYNPNVSRLRVYTNCLGLFYKLSKQGFSNKFLNIVKCMYDNVKSCIKLSSGYTDSFHSHVGTRQGCNLSPTLFNLFLNDLPTLLHNKCIDAPVLLDRKLPILMFADDIVLLSTSQSGLQHSLRLLESFCNKWRLSISLKKTKIMIFNANFNPHKYDFYVYDKRLDIVSSYTYLGITFIPSGNFKKARLYLKNKALRSLFAFMKTFNSQNGTPVEVQLHLFDSLVKPVLLYGSEVWGSYLFRTVNSKRFSDYFLKPNSEFEIVQMKTCKYILGVNKSACVHACLGELGRFPLLLCVIINVIKYWSRLESLKNNSLLAIAFELENKLHEKGLSTFLDFVKSVFAFCNCSHLMKVKNCKLSTIIRTVKDSLEAKFVDLWKKAIESNEKLNTYCKIKTVFKYEKYLSLVKNPFDRIALTKIRISNHIFPIEVGRYKNILRHRRLCTLCKSDVGDEFHCIMICNSVPTQGLRDAYCNSIFDIQAQLKHFDKMSFFKYIMSCSDDSIVHITAKFLNELMKAYKM